MIAAETSHLAGNLVNGPTLAKGTQCAARDNVWGELSAPCLRLPSKSCSVCSLRELFQPRHLSKLIFQEERGNYGPFMNLKLPQCISTIMPRFSLSLATMN